FQVDRETEPAVAAYRQAITLRPNYAEAHCNIGQVLWAAGQLDQALTHLRRGHELGSRLPGWQYPSGQWIHNAQRLRERERALPAVLSGAVRATDAAELLDYARVCRWQRRFVASARFFQQAFARSPALAEGATRGSWRRYDAACAAALAAAGQGEDAA